MEKKIRYTLGKEDRLKSRKAIGRLFKEGKSLSQFPFRVIYILTKEQPALENNHIPNTNRIQAGFTASSRNFKKAVDRNRIKRLLREAWRLQKHALLPAVELKVTLALFIIYTGKELPAYELVFEKTALVIKRFIKLINENN